MDISSGVAGHSVHGIKRNALLCCVGWLPAILTDRVFLPKKQVPYTGCAVHNSYPRANAGSHAASSEGPENGVDVRKRSELVSVRKT
jgi:hypothetical protein